MQSVDKTNGNSEDKVLSKKSERTLVDEVESSVQFKSNDNALAEADKSRLETNFDQMSGTVLNITEGKLGFSIPNHISNPNLNSAKVRFGNLASSHIVDYSAFLTKSPSVETSTIVPQFEAILSSPEQISSITGKEMSMTRTTTSQQNSGATINFGTEILPDKTGTLSTQTTGFPSKTSKIPENGINFRETAIFSTTDRISNSENILSSEPLLTSIVSSTPKLIIFPNRKNFDGAHVGIKLSPILDETGKSLENKVIVHNHSTTSIKNITEPKISSGNRSSDFGPPHPVTFIAVGDREILDEQKPQREASSILSTSRIVVGEQIAGMQEIHHSDSAKDEAAIVGKQAMITSLRKQDSNITKSTSSYRIIKTESAGVAEQTQSREPFQNGSSLGEAKNASPDVFLIPEQNFATPEPNYIESIDSIRTAISTADLLLTESEAEQRKNEILKSEFLSTQLPELMGHTQFAYPQLRLNLVKLDTVNDEMNISDSSEDLKAKPDFRVSQVKLVRILHSFSVFKISGQQIRSQFQDF